MSAERIEYLKAQMRSIPDFPKPGILFYDITPILGGAEAFRTSLDLLREAAEQAAPTAIVGIESRGFIFGAPLAAELGVGFVPVRKPGKLPHRTASVTYSLEYGEDTIEIHEDALGPDDRVFIVDDLLATGGTMAAACELVDGLGAEVIGCLFLVELNFLNGRAKLPGRAINSLLRYDS